MNKIEDFQIYLASNTTEKKDGVKEKRTKSLKKRVSKLNAVVKHLENNLTDSNQNDNYMLTTIHNDSYQHQKIVTQLEAAQKENKQLLNVLQQQHNDGELSRSTSRSQIDISSTYSTVSMVHLQYKYEELLSSHEGLLKILEMRLREMQNGCNENERLRDEIDNLTIQINDLNKSINELSAKYRSLKERKDRKINKLNYERNALKDIHTKLLRVFQRQQADIENDLTNELKITKEPTKALLLNEIRKNNILEYENIQLRQQLQFLTLKLEEGAKFANAIAIN